MPAEYSDAALLLRSVDYRETDRIVTLLTEHHGCVAAVARGARVSRRRFAGALSPFALLQVQVASQRGDLQRLASAEVSRGYLQILGNLERMRQAGAALNLVRLVAQEAPADVAMFEATVAVLDVLDTCELAELSAVRLAFAAQAIALSGWQPELEQCGLCGRRPQEGQAAQFDPLQGYLICRACGVAPLLLTGAVRAFLIHSAQCGATFQHRLVEHALSETALSQVEEAVAAILRCHVKSPVS